MTTPERSPDRASVRYHDPRDGRPGPDGRDGGGDWTERLALRNWSLPVKLTAVLLVPTLFVLTLGVLRIMEQTRDAAEFDGVQQAVALEDGTAQVIGDLADERSAAAVYVASGRAGGSGPVEERIGATRDAVSELRRSSGLADSLDQQTRTSFDQADAELDQLDRLRDDVIDGRVDAAGAIARLHRGRRHPRDLRPLAVPRGRRPERRRARLRALLAVGGPRGGRLRPGRRRAPASPRAASTPRRSTRRATPRCAARSPSTTSAPRSAPTTPGWPTPSSGPDVDNRDLLAQVVLGRGAAGLPLQVSGPDWERASSAVEDRDAAASEQLRGQLQEQAGALQQAARNGAGVASVILLLALMAGAAVVFFVTRSLLRPLRLLRRTALDVAERRLPAGRAQPARGRGARHHDRPDADHDARGDRPGRPRVRPGARAGGAPGRRAGGSAVGVQLDLRQPVAALPGARRAPAAAHRAAGELRGGPGGALQPLPARPPRDAHAPQLARTCWCSRAPTSRGAAAARCRWSTCCAPRRPRSSSTSASTSRRRPRPSCSGRTASDVVHLVAELLENATTFSAPDTRVQVAGDAERRRLAARRDRRLRRRHERGGPARRERAPRLAADRRRVGLAAHGPVRGRAPGHPPRHRRLAAQPRGRRRRRHGPGARLRGARRRARGRGDPGGHGRGARGGLDVRARPGPRRGHRAPAARPAPGWRSARVVLRARRRPRAGWRGRCPSRRRPRAPVVLPRRGSPNGAPGINGSNGSNGHGTNGTHGSGPAGPAGPGRPGGRPARDVPGPRPPSRRANPPAALRPRSPRPPRRPPRTRPPTAPPSRTSGVVTAWSVAPPPVGPRP